MNELAVPAEAEFRPDSERKDTNREDMSGKDINDRLVIRLRDLSHIMRSLYEGKGSQRRVLIVLSEMGDHVTQRQLTDRLGISSGSASEAVGKLEALGLIQRAINEADRRNVDIVLTELGQEMASKARLQRKERHERMFSCLSDEEKEQLMTLLNKVGAHWTQEFGVPAGPDRRCLRGHHSPCNGQSGEEGE